MANEAFFGEDGFVHNIFEGGQTEESINTVVRKSEQIISDLKNRRLSVLILTDLTKLGKSTGGSRRASLNALKQMSYDKVALFGANIYMKHLANMIMAASGMGGKVRYFDKKNDAVEWLNKGCSPDGKAFHFSISWENENRIAKIIISGPLTKDNSVSIQQELNTIIEEKSVSGKIDLLFDINCVTWSDLGARKAWTEWLAGKTTESINKNAACCKRGLVGVMAKMAMMASGIKNANYFKTESEAKKWLAEKT